MTIDVSTLSVVVQSTGVKETADGLNKVFQEAKKAEDRVVTLTGAIAKLSTGFQAGAASALAYQTAVANANRQVGGSNAATMALTQAMAALAATMNSLNSQFANLQPIQRNTQAVRSHNDALRDAHSLARGLAGSLDTLWVTYGRAIPLGMGLAIGTAFKQIVTVGKDVENTLENLRVKGEESFQSVDKMRAVVMDLGNGVYGPQEVARALETLILAGLNAQQAMTGVKDAMNLAMVGGTSIEKASTTLVQVATSLGYTSEGFGRVADVIAKSAAASMASVESLSEAFKSASSVGKLYGASLVDIGTGLAALAQLGIQGSAAGTSLKNFYKQLGTDTDKLKSTLATLKLTPADLKDSQGNFLDMVTVVEKLSAGLNNLTLAAQKQALAQMSNERSMKTIVEVLDLYRTKVGETGNALQEFRDKIADSYAYTSLGAAQLSLTVENQWKSVKNTLTTSLYGAFQGIEPQLVIIAAKMKDAFNSDDFKNGVQGIAIALSELAVWVVKNTDLIAAFVAAFVGFKVVSFVLSLVQSMTTGVIALAEAFTLARVSAVAFQASLGIIGAILIAAGAAWAYYSAQKKAASTDKHEEGLTNLNQYIEALNKENERTTEVNRLMREGTALREAETTATQNQAVALAEANKQKMVEAAQSKLTAAQQNFDSINSGKSGQGTGVWLQNITAAKQALAEAKANFAVVDGQATNLVSQVQRAVDIARQNAKETAAWQEGKIAQARREADEAAGHGTMPNKGGDKATKSAQDEIMSLDRLTNAYKAKTKAYEDGAVTQTQAMANVHQAQVQAEIDDNKFAKAPGMADKVMAAAKLADEAKFARDGMAAVHEMSIKLGKDYDTEKTALDQLNAGQVRTTGAREDAARSLLKEWNLRADGKFAKSLIEEAQALDKITAAKQGSAKANREAETLAADGRKHLEAAEALMTYGKAGKATAIQLAELYVKQQQLNPATQSAVIANVMAGASLKQLGDAAEGLAKVYTDMNSAADKSEADLVASLLTDESAKIAVKRETTLKTIDFYAQQAEAAKQLAIAEGKYDAERAAAYERVQQILSSARGAVDKNTATEALSGQMKNMATLSGEAKTFASDMQNAFGSAGQAIGNMVVAMVDLTAAQTKYNVALATAATERSKGNSVAAVKLEEEATQGLASSQLKAYATMTSGVKGFLDSKSKAYQFLTGVEKAFHAMSLALELKTMLQKIFFTETVTAAKVTATAIEMSDEEASVPVHLAAEGAKATASGITAFAKTMASLPFPYNIAAGAAVMALLIAAGVSMMGGGGGGATTPTLSEQRQSTQGTGTVLGDEGAKSDSIAKSLETLKTNSSIELTHSSQMLSALRSINDGIAGLAANISSSSGLRGTAADQLALGVGSSSGALGFNKSTTDLTDSGILFGRKTVTTPVTAGPDDMAWVQEGDGNMVQVKLSRGGFGSTGGTTTSVPQTLGDVLNGGLTASGYDDVHKTSSSWWGLSKSASDSEQLSQLDPALLAGMGRTLNSMFNSVIQAGAALGANPATSAAVMKALNLDQLGLTRISLKGLSGTDVEKELQAAFSKAGDVMAQAVMPGLEQFQKVGEGYYATMVRVSSGVEKGQYVLQQLGIQAVAYTDIQNKQGDTATEMVRDSIVNAESYKRAATDTEKAATDTVAAFLGLSGQLDDTAVIVTSNIGQIIEAFNGTADDMATLYKQLVALRDGFNATGLNGNNLSVDTIRGAGGLDALSSGLDAFVTNFFSEADQNAMKLATLTKEFQALGLTLPATKDGFVALVHAADDGTAAGNTLVGKLLTLADTFNTVAESAIKVADTALQTSLDALKRSVDAEKKRLTDIYNAQVDAIKKKQDLDTKAAQAQLKPAQDALAAIQTIFTALQNAIKSTTVDTAALNMARRQQAQNLLETAKQYTDNGGSIKDVAGLTDAMTDISKPSEQFFSTLQDYQRDQARTKMLLTDLSARAGHEVDKAQLTIDAINATIEAIKQTATNELDALAKYHQGDLDRLDAIVTNAQNQIDALNGIDNSVKSVTQAIAAFQNALLNAYTSRGQQNTPGGVAAAGNAAASQHVADAVKGVTDYGNQHGSDAYYFVPGFNDAASKIANAQATADLLNSETGGTSYTADSVLKLQDPSHGVDYWNSQQTAFDAGQYPRASLAVGTNHVPEDMTANIHEGERIIPKADNLELMRRLKSPDEAAQTARDFKDAVNDLKQIIMAGDVANVQKTKELTKIFQRWDTNGMPTVRSEVDV